ncbi:hypothetical protein ACLOJK_009441 [Asimina triloba]
MRRASPAPIPNPRKSQHPSPPVSTEITSGDAAAALSISDQRTLYLVIISILLAGWTSSSSASKVNIFIANTARFLNSFSAICEQKLLHVHRRILRLDATLSLLEAKLRSIDGVGKSEDCGVAEVVELSNQLDSNDSSTIAGPSEPKDGYSELSSAADITEQKMSILPMQMSIEATDPAILNHSTAAFDETQDHRREICTEHLLAAVQHIEIFCLLFDNHWLCKS